MSIKLHVWTSICQIFTTKSIYLLLRSIDKDDDNHSFDDNNAFDDDGHSFDDDDRTFGEYHAFDDDHGFGDDAHGLRWWRWPPLQERPLESRHYSDINQVAPQALHDNDDDINTDDHHHNYKT